MLRAMFPLPRLGRAQGLAAPGHHGGTGRVAHDLLLGWRGQGHVGGHGALKALVGVKAGWEGRQKEGENGHIPAFGELPNPELHWSCKHAWEWQ